MEHAENEEIHQEYLIPLSGQSPKPSGTLKKPINRPSRSRSRTRFDVEEPAPSTPDHPRRPSRGSPQYPSRINPINYGDTDSRAGYKDDHSPIIPNSESISSHESVEYNNPPVGHKSSSKFYRESPKRRLMFDGTVQNISSSSAHSDSHSFEFEKEPDSHGVGKSSQENIEPITFWNITLPLNLSRLIKQPPNLYRMSVFIVQIAPCFWCCRNSVHSGSTDRAVLTRLNMLCLFFTFSQVFIVSLLVVFLLILDEETGTEIGPHLWNLNGLTFAVGTLALIIIIICFCTIRAIREVDLVGAIRYLWAIFWIVPFEVFFNVSLFDYHKVTSVWIRHWWMRPSLSWFRGYFCPDGTQDSLCIVPIMGGGDYPDEDSWCLAKYNTTVCASIRDEAQESMEASMLAYYTTLGAWGCLLLLIMLLIINSLERIISKPIVQKSRETNVPAWLLLPSMGNAFAGSLFLFSPSSLLSSNSGAGAAWIGLVYLVTAVLFFVAMLMGWFLSTFSIQDNIDKKKKSIAVIVFIVVMAANTVLLATLFVSSLILSAELIESPIDESDRGTIACYVDGGGTCTQCGETGRECPEWTLEEVTNILRTQLKQSATIAAIFFLYSISVLRFGFVLRKHLSMYQIDYV